MAIKHIHASFAVDIPTRYTQQIGIIVTRWAYIEWRLHQICYRLLNVSPKVGRIAIREPKESQYIDMIEDLMELDSIPVPAAVAKVRTELDKWGKSRNLVAHGLWLRDKKSRKLMIQSTAGQWDKSKLDRGQTLSRKVLPEAIFMDLDKLKEIAHAVTLIGMNLEKFYLYVDAKATSREKSLGLSPNPDHREDHAAQKFARLPPAFRG